jgi:hypothetical protein
MLSGVSKSGSPWAKLIISIPCLLSLFAIKEVSSVAEGLMPARAFEITLLIMKKSSFLYNNTFI